MESSEKARPETATGEGQTDAVSHAEQTADIEAFARRYRHAGYTVFGLLALFTVGFLIFQVCADLSRGDVYDPFTGERVWVGDPQPLLSETSDID